eukprot:2233092-Prymnesium_polylepis.1
MRQAFVPELKKLRRGHFALAGTAIPATSGGSSNASLLEVAGAQLELLATFRVPRPGGTVGLTVLAGPRERTVIAIDASRQLVLLDRTLSGAAMDADVRAGPLVARSGEFTTVHAFVDHSIVTLIADDQTALTSWVHPQDARSIGVGLFAAGSSEPGELVSLDVWQLADA